MKIKIILLFISFFSTTILSAQKELAVGDKAPEINVTNYIENIPQDKYVKGKYILLEFWATWCGPCLGAVPHLNTLREKYKERGDILFLSMTYEEPEKILKTLKRIQFKTSVVTDQSNITFKGFGVERDGTITVPRTILIDNKGIIKWIGNPFQLTDSLFDNFVNEKTIKQDIVEEVKSKVQTPVLEPNIIEAATQVLKDKQTKFCFSLIESENKPTGQWASKSPLRGRYFDVNNSLWSILSDLLGVPKTQIVISDSIKDKRYCLFYRNDQIKDSKTCIDDIKSNLLKALNLKEKIEQRTIEIYLMTVSDNSKLDVSEDKNGQSHSGVNDTHLTFSNTKIESVIKTVSEFNQIIIINNTNLLDNYDFLIHKGSVEDLTKDFKSYGLTLKKVKKEMTFYYYD